MSNESGLKNTNLSPFNRGSSDSTFEIKIKTLDLQIYSFRVNKNLAISALKEEIVTKIGVPIEQQRLLYKGKLLNDEQLLSELNLVDGDILHLVDKRPVYSQPTSSTVAVETSRTSNSQGAGSERSQNTSRIQLDNSANGGQRLLDQAQSSVQFAGMADLDSENEDELLPDALPVISGHIDLIERALQSSSNSLIANQHQMFTTYTNTEPSDIRRALQSPEYLGFLLGRTEQLLRDNVATALSDLSTRLQRRESFSDPVSRGQIRFGAMQLGVTLRHLGALFLELGRVIPCLRIGQTSEESFVDAGWAAYISPTMGLHPGMIQPSGLQPWVYNHYSLRIERSVPIGQASHILGVNLSTGGQFNEPTSQPPPPSGSDYVPTLGAQSTASIPNVLCSNAQVQCLSNAMQSGATQDFHSAMKENELSGLEDLPFGTRNDEFSGDSENVLGAEEGKQSGSGENHDSYLAVEGKVEQQVDIGQVVERIEQNGDPRSIFGALLEFSARLCGEQNVYHGIVELGNNEELANEFMEVLRREIRRRLAKESSSMDEL